MSNQEKVLKHLKFYYALVLALESMRNLDVRGGNISDKVLFEQATVAMEEMYGYGCETEIDAYFRGLKWMQKQLNKKD
jgi:hypothetical protein